MLDRIQNNNLDTINQGNMLEKILSGNATNPIERDEYRNYLIDESDISASAFQKYQRELDIKKFSDILKETDQKEADSLVIGGVFKGNIDIENPDIFATITGNKSFLDDIFNEI